MNPFLLSPTDRLADWKNFRHTLSELPEKSQLDKVASYWAQCPLQIYSLDFDQPQTWPTPWELIHDGDFCRNAVALGMEMTLRVAGWAAERLTLLMVKDTVIEDMMMVVKIDDDYLLNYTYGQVVQYPPRQIGFHILGAYGWANKKYTDKSALAQP